MRYFFYNSFTLGSGYKYAELKNNVICSTDVPKDIDCDFCNGGCQLVVKKTNSNTSILIVKGILYVNNQKKFDEQGRKVYINFAIEASVEEHKILNNIFYAIIVEWNNLSKYLGESVKIPCSVGTYGYGIEQKRIEFLIHYLSAYNTDKIKKEIGVVKDNLNVIVLKSSDYSYYEDLAKDLYKNNKISFKGNFIRENIITGEHFSELISKSSVEHYDDFLLMVNGTNKSDSIHDNHTDSKLDSTNNSANDNNFHKIEEINFTIQEKKNDEDNEKAQVELIKTDRVDIRTNESVVNSKVYKIKGSYSKFILGFVCGLFIGYLIWS